LLAPSTFRHYSSAVECRLIPVFCDIPLAALTTRQVREWIAEQVISAKRINNVLIP